MKIIQTCGSRSWGGLEMLTLSIADALAGLGHGVSLICPPGSTLEEQARQTQVDVQPIVLGDTAFLGDLKRLTRFFRDSQPDVIHTHLSHDMWTVVPAMNLTKSAARFLLTKHMGSGVSKKDILHRQLYKRLDAVLTISEIIHRDVLDTCPVPPDKVFTLINGVELDRFDPERVDGSQVRRELGIGPEEILIGHIGRLTPGKGQREFLRAAGIILNRTKSPCSFLMVGDVSFGEESYEEEVGGLIDSLGLGTRLIRLPFRKEIVSLYAALDILAFPSYDESLGNVLLEAMAMRLPVVGSNSGSVPELVSQGENGLLVPPRQSAPLAEALLTLIENPSGRKRMGQNSRKRVETNYSFRSYIQSLIGYYSEG